MATHTVNPDAYTVPTIKADSCLSASLRRRFRGSSTKATECGPFTHGNSGCSTPTIQRPFGRWAGPVRPKRREPDKHELTLHGPWTLLAYSVRRPRGRRDGTGGWFGSGP